MEITVSNLFHTYHRVFVVPPEETILDLRRRVAEDLRKSPYEIVIHGAPPLFPYPFSDVLILDRLAEEHRHVYVVIVESPEHAVPSRLLTADERLDLRHVYPEDLCHLKRWTRMTRIRGIDLRWSDPLLPKILHALTHCMSIVNLTCIWFHADEDGGVKAEDENAVLKEIRYLLRHTTTIRDCYQIHADPGLLGNTSEVSADIYPEQLETVDLIAAEYLRAMIENTTTR